MKKRILPNKKVRYVPTPSDFRKLRAAVEKSGKSC